MTWNDHLLALVQTGTFRKQGELVAALAVRGFTVHQGSVSRELRSLGVTKVRGVYVVPDTPLGAPLHNFQVTAGGCMVVLRTEPAFASVLAQAIDGADLSGVLGTIAGDDTVFVATTGTEGARALARMLDLPHSPEDS